MVRFIFLFSGKIRLRPDTAETAENRRQPFVPDYASFFEKSIGLFAEHVKDFRRI